MAGKIIGKKKLKWFLRNYKRLTRKELVVVMGLHPKSIPRTYKKLIKRGIENYYGQMVLQEEKDH